MKSDRICWNNDVSFRFSFDVIINMIQRLISFRNEIDSKENAIDSQSDLPVYHRIRRLLSILISNVYRFNKTMKDDFRKLTSIILDFDQTLSPLMGTLLIKLAESKEELEDILQILENQLPKDYFDRLIIRFSDIITSRNSTLFIQQLNVDEKFQFCHWFIKEKNRPLFVFDLLKKCVFNQSNIDQEKCQDLLKEIRQSDDLYLREQALEYVVPWKKRKQVRNNRQDKQKHTSDDQPEPILDLDELF